MKYITKTALDHSKSLSVKSNLTSVLKQSNSVLFVGMFPWQMDKKKVYKAVQHDFYIYLLRG